jgi:hypothetical protein
MRWYEETLEFARAFENFPAPLVCHFHLRALRLYGEERSCILAYPLVYINSTVRTRPWTSYTFPMVPLKLLSSPSRS